MEGKKALIILDMLNTFDFPEGSALLPQAKKVAGCIEKLKVRCHKNKIPVIYVNDNFGMWQSNWKDIYEKCTLSTGSEIALMLQPDERDYFVLKPKHSGFYSTTLEVLLDDLGVKNLILTGVAGNICVLFTANDAHMRDYKVIVPRDCIASNTKKDNDYAIHHFNSVFKFRTSLSSSIRL